MSSIPYNSDQLLENQNASETVSGAAYANTGDDGVSIMPPEPSFSTQPLETGGMIPEPAGEHGEKSNNSENEKWITPRENEEVSTKSAATIKLHQVRVHINYLLDLYEGSGDIAKRPDSIEDLVKLAGDCENMMKVVNEGDSSNAQLDSRDAVVLNDMTSQINYSYADVFGEITAQSKRAARNIGTIPDMEGVDDSLRELIRQNFEEENQGELDKIMYTLEETNEYHRIVAVLKSAAWGVVGELGGAVWAEGEKKIGDKLSKALKEFKGHADYIMSFVTGLIDVFGMDESDSVGGMRKTFDLIDTIIDNPLCKTLVPLWTAYRPAINFCLDGIAMIENQWKENFKIIGITKGLIKYVKNNDKKKITVSMTQGLQGEEIKGKHELLLFMMDIHTKAPLDAFNLPVTDKVRTFFEKNQDLVNAGDKERLSTDYKNPLNPFDNELGNISGDVYANKGLIWTMLYGTMLTPPSR